MTRGIQALCLALAALCCGCGQCPRKQPATAPGGTASNAVVDVITQRSAVKAAKHARSTIQAVNAIRQENFEEAVGKQK